MDMIQNAIASYIRERSEYLCNRTAYQYGYNSLEGIVYGLRELQLLAAHAHIFDTANTLRDKVERLEPYLTKHGIESVAGFVNEL